MVKSYKFWLWFTLVIQLLTAGVHALSLVIGPQPTNDTDKQMLELMAIKNGMGAGFNPSMMDFFLALSSCFTFLYLFGGLINLYVIRRNAEPEFVKGLINISLLIFVPCFGVMLFLTFLPPVILTALVAIGLIATRLTIPKAS
jgi:hypothetical protein